MKRRSSSRRMEPVLYACVICLRSFSVVHNREGLLTYSASFKNHCAPTADDLSDFLRTSPSPGPSTSVQLGALNRQCATALYHLPPPAVQTGRLASEFFSVCNRKRIVSITFRRCSAVAHVPGAPMHIAFFSGQYGIRLLGRSNPGPGRAMHPGRRGRDHRLRESRYVLARVGIETCRRTPEDGIHTG